jgi:hypothetical protein
MRKLIMVAATVAALAIPSSALANASGSTGIDSTGLGSTQGGKSNTTQQYRTSYVDGVMGPVTCAGVHQSGKAYSALGQDSFTCASTTGLPLTNVSPGEVVTAANFPWISDYYKLLGQTVYATSFTLTVSADGLSEMGVASY